jgi:hypothetical protein
MDPFVCQRALNSMPMMFAGSHRHRSMAARAWVEPVVLALVRVNDTPHTVYAGYGISAE